MAQELPIATRIDLAGEPPLPTSGCRPGCAACCIAPSISTPMPKMPHGKPAGVACLHLDAALRCELFGSPERPAVCARLRPQPEMCGSSQAQALAYLNQLEQQTRSTGE